jgi:hypothetical protein
MTSSSSLADWVASRAEEQALSAKLETLLQNFSALVGFHCPISGLGVVLGMEKYRSLRRKLKGSGNLSDASTLDARAYAEQLRSLLRLVGINSSLPSADTRGLKRSRSPQLLTPRVAGETMISLTRSRH